MTPDQFAIAVTGLRMSRRTRRALRMVLVDGRTWRAAASRCSVAQSTILRAMRRIWEAPPVQADPPAGAVPVSAYASSTPTVPGEVAAIVQRIGGKGRIVRRITGQT
jgi:hypothetical protein